MRYLIEPRNNELAIMVGVAAQTLLMLPMPTRFYFDSFDDGVLSRDSEGIVSVDLDHARSMAAVALAEYALEVVADAKRKVLEIHVRTERQVLLITRLSFDVEKAQ